MSPVWGAYIWRGLFSEFHGILLLSRSYFGWERQIALCAGRKNSTSITVHAPREGIVNSVYGWGWMSRSNVTGVSGEKTSVGGRVRGLRWTDLFTDTSATIHADHSQIERLTELLTFTINLKS